MAETNESGIRKLAPNESHVLCDRGAAAVEYGIMIAAVAAVIVLSVFGLGGKTEQALEGLVGLWP